MKYSTIRQLLFLLLVCLPLFAVAQEEQNQTLWQPYYVTPRVETQHIPLAEDWELGHMKSAVQDIEKIDEMEDWILAERPGTVHWALYRSGRLPDFYKHMNSKKYEWVEDVAWYYRKNVTIPEHAKGKYIFLCFDGVDYLSKVWVNGTYIGRHEGMFGGPAVEISDKVQFGQENEIILEVQSGKDMSPNNAQVPGRVIKPWEFTGGLGAEPWYTVGMWQGARIEIVPKVHMERPFLTTKSLSEYKAHMHLNMEILANTQSLKHQLHRWDRGRSHSYKNAWTAKAVEPGVSLQIRFQEKNSSKTAYEHTFPLNVDLGRNWIEQDFTIIAPKLWWPNGMGQQNLYDVDLTLIQNQKEIDRIRFTYGIRTLDMKPSAGPQTDDRWADWQFVINGRPIFVKGINWMPADVLLDLTLERYEWLIDLAKNAGIQMFRIWGAGLLETREFYEMCNRNGIMVWQDFPIANWDSPEYPQDVWEAQVLWNIFRIRNHPSLFFYCGGNEFNPYSKGNATSIGILERSLDDFDPTRPFLRTSPDEGSIHTYPDMDPTWYERIYKYVPYIAETGMHSITEARSLREIIDESELDDLGNMYTDEFKKNHPEFIHHFVEFNPARVPRMLSRASHIDDMAHPVLEAIAEASQIGAGEFYQVLSDRMQANFPITTGLMPWVFKRPWPVVAGIHLVDGYGQPSAPYYFLKRTYEPTHIMVKFPHLLWASGEEVDLPISVTHSPEHPLFDLTVSVEMMNTNFDVLWQKTSSISHIPAGPSVTDLPEFGSFQIPTHLKDQFFLIKAELLNSDDQIISRSIYWPRSLSMMEDNQTRNSFRQGPKAWPTLENGPWLKRDVAKKTTSLALELLESGQDLANRSTAKIKVKNIGNLPSFMTTIDIAHAKRAFYATDNYFWMEPGEERILKISVHWREHTHKNAKMILDSWNAKPKEISFE